MLGLTGFKYPDVRRIVVTKRITPILIPVYNVSERSLRSIYGIAIYRQYLLDTMTYLGI